MARRLRAQPPYDLVVAQGANGQHALDSLLTEYETTTGSPLAHARANVRSTHLLTDPADPFHSEFRIGVSSGSPLADQCRDAIALIPGHADATTSQPLQIAVFDDCIQTGRGTQAVAEQLLSALHGQRPATVHTLGFIACQATQDRFAARGWRTEQGVLLPGQTYPQSWDTDIYFLKDLILDNAIRFTDGTSHAYIDDPEWMRRIFAADPAGATRALSALRDTLNAAGVYPDLVAL